MYLQRPEFLELTCTADVLRTEMPKKNDEHQLYRCVYPAIPQITYPIKRTLVMLTTPRVVGCGDSLPEAVGWIQHCVCFTRRNCSCCCLCVHAMLHPYRQLSSMAEPIVNFKHQVEDGEVRGDLAGSAIADRHCDAISRRNGVWIRCGGRSPTLVPASWTC